MFIPKSVQHKNNNLTLKLQLLSSLFSLEQADAKLGLYTCNVESMNGFNGVVSQLSVLFMLS